MKYGIRHSRPRSLMDEFFDNDLMNNFSYGSKLDIYKENDNYIVELEMPGFDRENINIEYKGDVLSIKAHHEEQEESDEKNYFYQSRNFQNVHRQIRFNDVDETKVEADYTDGVLKIVLPSKVEADVVNKIEVK